MAASRETDCAAPHHGGFFLYQTHPMPGRYVHWYHFPPYFHHSPSWNALQAGAAAGTADSEAELLAARPLVDDVAAWALIPAAPARNRAREQVAMTRRITVLIFLSHVKTLGRDDARHLGTT